MSRVAGGGDVSSGRAIPMDQRLLEAARRIIIDRGLGCLTLRAIEAESGASASLIHYHFGGKNGLLSAVIDSLFDTSGNDNGHEFAFPVDLTSELELDRKVSAHYETQRLFFELLPHILRSEELLQQLRDRYAQARAVERQVLRSFASDAAEDVAEEIAGLLLAMSDGLGLQLLIDADDLDRERVHRRWEDMVVCYLKARTGHVRPGEAPATESSGLGSTCSSDIPPGQVDD